MYHATMSSMTHTSKEKFSSQADPQLLAALRGIAVEEGRQFQAVLDDALSQYVEAKKSGKPRRHVLEAFETSMATYDDLYSKLAK